MTARTQTQWVTVAGRSYMPQTFAMAIGTRDLRKAAGQTNLPSAVGQYTVRLKVDGRSVGLAFFRILKTAKPLGTTSSPEGSRSYKVQESAPQAPLPDPSPVVVPTLEPLKLPYAAGPK